MFFWAALLMAGVVAHAATLKLGDAAPPLQTGQWLQGAPLPGLDTNHVYLLVFWTATYDPCQVALARINGIAEMYQDKGLVAIGQDVYEKNEDGIPAYLKKMGKRLTYRVALDDKSRDPEGAMFATWMKAADQTNVPVAFVVDRQGKIAWMGHPMALEQTVLDKILANEFDVAAHAREVAKQQAQQQQEQTLAQKLSQALQARDWDAADAVTKELENSLPPSARYQMGAIRLRIAFGRKDFTSGYQLAGALSDAFPNDIYLQNQLAWTLATTSGLDSTGLALTEKIAGRANAAASGRIPGVLDTLARAQFLNGHTNEAVVTEQKAVEAESLEGRAALMKCLEAYRQGKLPEIDLSQP